MNLDYIIFAGVIQGFIVSIVHLISSKRSQGRYLSLFIMALSFQLLLQSREVLLIIGSLGPLIALMDSVVFLISPLFYFYIFISFYRSIKPRIPFVLHLIPFFIGSLIHLVYYLILGKDGFYKLFIETLAGNSPNYINLLLILKLISGTIYSILIVRLFFLFREEPKIKRFYLIPSIFIITWGVILVLAIGVDSTPLRYLLQVLLFMIFIYVITIYSRLKPEVFSYSFTRSKIKSNLNIDDRGVNSLVTRIYKEVESRIYLDPDLNLSKLSKKLGVHENLLSFVINDKTGKNFTTYINSFRVEHFIELALSERLENETILSLAFESGFSSKSSFNRVFKELKGLSPSAYLKEKEK